MVDGAEILITESPVNGDPGTSKVIGATVNDISLLITNLTVVVCPCGVTVPVMFVIVAVNGD